MTSGRRGFAGSLDRRLLFLVSLAVARGDRSEAETETAAGVRSIDAVLTDRPGGIRRKQENKNWSPALHLIGMFSFGWFLLTAALGVSIVLLVPVTSSPWVRVSAALLPAVPSALFVSRQICHAIVRRALRNGTASGGLLRCLAFWYGDAMAALLTLVSWVGWAALLR
ncbi:hypothetical protein [Streptomyces sp. NPDC002845]